MSKTIDQRVVEMRFDNRDFESNVRTSMSTLERLKSALKLDKAATGLTNLSSVAKQVNLSGLDNGIQTVNARFSALQVAGMTALSNITTAAMTAGKNLVSSFTIDPITNGFREYELQMNSVQTIMANTASKGTTIDQVTSALNELNEYADLTIYNFAEMTKNIGTFTAAGVDLDKATAAIKGIANLGAMSGSTSMQVNTAMYQLSQALATGRVSLMDWNSVVNAGMGGEQFQNALKRTAEHMGTDMDAMMEKYGTFRESLTRGGWLTAEVLTETLNQISGAYSEADLIAQGYSQDQAAAIAQMATTATEAATKVKTFTQLLDTMGEAAGSGWAKTWQTLFGDFYEARDFFTDLSGYFGEIIDGMSDARNNVLGDAFNSNWTKLQQQVEEAGLPFDKFTERLKETSKEYGTTVNDMINDGKRWDEIAASGAISGEMVVKTLKSMASETTGVGASTEEMSAKLEKFQKVVNDVWMGDYKNGEERVKALTEAGYDYAYVQDLVNKTVDGHKLTLADLGEEQLKAVGYTEDEIKAIQELAAAAEDANTPLNELINNLEKPSGRKLFLDSLQNVLKAIIDPLKAVGKAFAEVFAVNPDSIYNAIESFNRFSKAIMMNEDSLDKLTSTFKGIFGIIKIFTTLLSGGLGIAFSALTGILEHFDLNILDVTAAVGEAVYAFSEWLTGGQIFGDMLTGLQTILGWVTEGITAFFESFGFTSPIETATEAISGFFTGIKDYFSELMSMSPADAIGKIFSDISNSLGTLSDKFSGVIAPLKDFFRAFSDLGPIKYATDAISNFVDSVKKKFDQLSEIYKSDGLLGVFKQIRDDITDAFTTLKENLSDISWEDVLSVFTDFGEKIKEKFEELKTGFEEIGPNIIEGLQNGITEGAEKVYEFLSNMANQLIGVVKGILGIHSPSTVFFEIGKNIIDGLCNGIEYTSGRVSQTISALVNDIKSAFSGVDWGVVLPVVGILGSLVILYQLTDAMQSFGKAATQITSPFQQVGNVAGSISKTIDDFRNTVFTADTSTAGFDQFARSVLIIAGAIDMVYLAIKGLSEIDPSKLWEAVKALGVIAGILAAMTIAIGKFGNLGGGYKGIAALGTMLLSLSGAMILLGFAAQIMAGIEWEGLAKGGAALAALGIVVAGLTYVTKYAGNLTGATAMIGGIATAFLLLSVAARIMGGMSPAELQTAVDFLGVFGIVMGLLIGVTQYAGDSVDEAGDFALKVGGAFILLAITAKIVGSMSPEEMQKGVDMLSAFGIVVMLLIAVTQLAGKYADKAAAFIGKIGIAFLALGVAAKIIGSMEWSDMGKAAVGLIGLALIIGILVAITNLAPEKEIAKLTGTLVGMAIAIGILAGIAALLSYMDVGGLVKGIAAVSVLAIMMSLMTKATRGATEVKGTMMGIAVAIGVMAAAVYALSTIETGPLFKAVGAMSALMAVFAVVAKASSNIKTAAPVMFAMVAAIAVMAGAIWLLSGIPFEQAITATASLVTVMLSFAAALKIISMCGEISGKAMASVVLMVAVMAAIAGLLILMSTMQVQNALPNALALSMVLLAMSAACKVLSTIQEVSTSALQAMGVLTAVVAGLALVFGLMTAMNVQGALPNALALSMVLLAMSAACAVLGTIKSISTSAMEAMVVLTFVVGGLGLVFGLMTAMNVQGALPNALALSTVLLAMSAACFVMGTIGTIAPMAMAAMGVLTLVVAGLAGVLIAMSEMDVQSAMPNAVALSTLLLAMSVALGVLTLVGLAAPAALAGIGALVGLIAAVGGLLIAIGALVTYVPQVEEFLNRGIPVLEAIGSAIGGFIGNFVGSLMSGIADQLVPIGMKLSAFMMAVQPFIQGANNIDPSAMEGVKTLAEALILITGGELLSAITEFFTGGVDYDKLGQDLSKLGNAVKSFADSTSDIDGGKLSATAEATKNLITAISEIPNEGGLLGSLLGGNNYEGFAKGLESIGTAVNSFYGATSEIDGGKLQSAAEGTGTLIDTLSSIPNEGGLLGALLGGNNYEGFAAGLTSIGDAVNSFCTSTTDVDPGTVAPKAEALSSLITALNGIEPTGGFVQAVMGGTDYSGFATSLEQIGSALGSFGNNTAEVSPDKVTNMGIALGNFISSMNDIEPQGFAWKVLNGQDFSKFGESMSTLASALANCSTEGLNLDNVSTFGSALKSLMDSLSEITEKEFSSEKVAELKSALDELATVNINNVVEAFNAAGPQMAMAGTNMITQLVNGIKMGSPMILLAMMSIVMQATMVVSVVSPTFLVAGMSMSLALATGIMSGAGMVTAAVTMVVMSSTMGVMSATPMFLAAGISMVLALASGIMSGTGMVSAAVTTVVMMAATMVMSAAALFLTGGMTLMTMLASGMMAGSGMVISTVTMIITMASATVLASGGLFLAGGTMLISMLASGMLASAGLAQAAAITVVNMASSGLKSAYGAFYSAGQYVASGFAAGIRTGAAAAVIAARAMANAASAAAKAALDINSPSRVFYQIGDYTGQGFINALTDYQPISREAGYAMGDDARRGLTDAISKMSDAVDSDMEMNPTIRPVVDLTEVEAGVNAVNDMFNTVPLNVVGNANRINRMMDGRNQNGTFDDVVSAIDKLRKSIGDVGSNTYNINGITYDDGTAVAQAVESLTRAMRIERRV